LDGKNVAGLMRAAREGTFDLVNKPIWISNDGHVLDGHHRWAAASALSSNEAMQIPVIRVDMPMDELLVYAAQFNVDMGVEHRGFGDMGTPGGSNFTAPAAASAAMIAATAVPTPDANGDFEMATDEEDGIPDDALTDLAHGDGSGVGYQPKGQTAAGLTAADFSPDLHPRGRDGQFIEKLGIVQLFNVPGIQPGQRGKVRSIAPNRKTPGRPDILVQLEPRDGKPGKVYNVKPDNIAQAPEKARLDTQPGPKNVGGYRERDHPDQAGPKQSGELERLRGHQREAADRARTVSDEKLAAQLPTAGPLWRTAIQQEQENRARRRAADNANRQQLIDSINADAANLSTTDPEARAEGLDAILAKLRFSIIDTDQVHDHIYPPGESGRWSPERAAQHEQMWEDLLSQVQAAGIPQEHDAFVLGGLPGAGKSFSLLPGQKAQKFGVVAWEPNGPMPDGTTHVSINPDIVKEMLIGRGMLPEGISQDLKPMEQVTFLHEESSYVAKLFSQRLGDLGYNVVLDNTMDSEGGMMKRMTPLARQGYKFRGLFVDIPVDESKASARKRYLDAALSPQGGRFVPSSVQGNRASSRGTLSKNRDAMDSLVEQDWFTEFMIVDNTGVSTGNAKGEVLVQGTGGGTAATRYLPSADMPTAPAAPAAPAAPVAAPA
jgi:hypothetical protein